MGMTYMGMAMTRKIFLAGAVSSGLLLAAAAVDANSEFQQWMQQQSQGIEAEKKEFQEYKDARDKEFTAFLKANWKEVDIVKGEVRDEDPKPVVMPVAPEPPAPPVVIQPRADLPVEQPVKPPVTPPVKISVPEPVAKKPVAAPVTKVKGKLLVIDFYGKQVRLYYDGRLKQNVSGALNKEAVSNYWSALSKTDYDDLTAQLMAQKESLQLNDWAYASLINQVASKINQNKKNESALLSWFLLTKSGYKARVA
jgi:hypothetical protein